MEEESSVDPKAHATPDTFGETLLYDFAKFLTSLSLLALGGVLSLTQAANKTDVKPANIVAVLVAIAAAGAISVTSASHLVDARAFNRPARNLRRHISVAIALLCIGTGGFLAMWVDTIN